MNFKSTKNLKNKKVYYFIDGKRVNHEKYEFKYTLCFIKNKQMHSSWTIIDQKAGFIKSGFCFD